MKPDGSPSVGGRTADYDYPLPPDLIAQQPLDRRDASRLMVLDRRARSWAHRRFTDLPDYLDDRDLLVFNNTKVIPSRLFGRKPSTGGRVEFLLLEPADDGAWWALVKARSLPPPDEAVEIGDGAARMFVLERTPDGRARVRVECGGTVENLLESEGVTPLPPYIRRPKGGTDRASPDRDRYQTVYARHPGAVAAPTAGLHFTPDLLAALERKGVRRAEVTLHVGIGTFRPVDADRVADHRMEPERYDLPPAVADAVAETRRRGGRVIAVGSTSARTLETAAVPGRLVQTGSDRTAIFIHPPYDFRVVDAMVTNFHLPRSTLLMMISALAGREFVLDAYAEAVRERYRFFSYGDAMLIL